jgi:predicted type IV restriction endonuclease
MASWILNFTRAGTYCSVLGLRWGLLTDGRLLQVYDAPVTGVVPAQRLVVELDLDDWIDREDFERRIWPQAAMLTKAAPREGAALERCAARERIRALLADRPSRTVRALQRELRTETVLLDTEAVVSLTSELVTMPTPPPRKRST